MTNIKFRSVVKSSTLANTNAIVAQKEQVIGQLAVIGHSADDPATPADEAMTVLGFDASKFPVVGHSVIVKLADLPAAIAPTCKGKIYIEGTLTDCAAYLLP